MRGLGVDIERQVEKQMCAKKQEYAKIITEGLNLKRLGASIRLFEKLFVEVVGIFIGCFVMLVKVLHLEL